ncbi:MAG TPA: TetR family transcriptional regulator [Lacisediminihabitans sp.]|uniref:TetR/AcrR family transcriptional regulator n=1 Tax=Lacisediminihabitans sp. TaxID=2787631 RepID=UPI002EDA8129
MTRIPLEERRRALISAAVRVVSREGVAAATTRAIVLEAGMPLGAFHYVFDSRDELLAAVIDAVTEEERLAAEAVLGRDTTRPPQLNDVLSAGLDRYIDLLVADPTREQALFELSLYSLRNEALAGMAPRQYEIYYRSVRRSLELAASACRHRWDTPVDRVAHHLVVALDGVTTTWLADRNTAAARDTALFVADSVARLARSIDLTSQGTHAD